MSSEHAQLLLLWARSSSNRRSKLRIPNRVTSANKGPLSLKVESQGKGDLADELHLQGIPSGLVSPHTYPTPHHYHQTQKLRRSLTKCPIKMLERPLELVERELGTLSCAQFRNSLQNWVPPASTRFIQLPPLVIPPPLDYQELQHIPRNTSLAIPPSLQHTAPRTSALVDNSTTAPMNVTITYNSRHSTPVLNRPIKPDHSLLTSLAPLQTIEKVSHTSTQRQHPYHRHSRMSKGTTVPSLPETGVTNIIPPQVKQLKKTSPSLPLPDPSPFPPTCQFGHGLLSTTRPGGGGGSSAQGLQPLLNSQTIIKGQGLATTQNTKLKHQEELETTDTH